MRIPFVDLKRQYSPIRTEIQEKLGQVMEGMQLFLGENVQALEQEFAAYCGTRFAVGVGSGTDALYVALRAAGIGPGDEVITVAHTFIATAEAIALTGAVPVLVDQAKERGFHPKTVGADKNYDTRDCVAGMRQRGVTPHVAQNTSNRSSAIDGRTTRHSGYADSQRHRKRVEEIFGWMKRVGGFRRTRYHGVDRTGLAGYLVATAYNLVRMVKLVGGVAPTVITA